MVFCWDVRIIVLLTAVTTANAAWNLCLNGTINTSSGIMNDGSTEYQNYANRLFCERVIVAPPGWGIVVTFTRFETESKYDVLTFFDGANTTNGGMPLARLSGSWSAIPHVIRSTKNTLLVRFTSDESVTYDGFEFSWAFAAVALGVEWSLLNANAPFGPVDSMPLLVFNNQLVLVTAGTAAANAWRSADGGVSWQRLAPNAFPQRWAETFVVHDGRMWLIGGNTLNGYLRDVLYSSNGVDWALDPNPAPLAARDVHSSVVYNGSIWTLGGFTGSSYLADVWNASVRYPGAGSLAWALATSSPGFSARWGHAHVVHQSQMFVIAGTSADVAINDIWRSTSGREWFIVTNAALFSPRTRIMAVSYVGRIWVIGGGGMPQRATCKDIWSSPDGASWALETPAETPFGLRWAYRIVVFQSHIVFVAGSNYSGSAGGVCADVWTLRSSEPASELAKVTNTPTSTLTLTTTLAGATITSSVTQSASATNSTNGLPSFASATITSTTTTTRTTSSTFTKSLAFSPTSSTSSVPSSTYSPSTSRSPNATSTHTPSETLSVHFSHREVLPHPLPVDCVGQWRPVTTTCSVTCGTGILVSMFEITTVASHRGRSCEVASGTTRTTPCALEHCLQNSDGEKVAENCVFVATSPCSVECDGGQLIETFLVVTKANGNGTPCEFPAGYTRTQPCNTDPCGLGLNALVGLVRQHLWFVVICGLLLLITVLSIVSLTCCCCKRRRSRRSQVENRMDAYRVHDPVGTHQPPPLAFPRIQAPAGPLRHLPPPLNPDFHPNIAHGPGRLYPDTHPQYPELDVELGPNAELNDGTPADYPRI